MGKRKRRRDPFADYIEWTNNRYNPGHYLGGNIPPYLRKSSLGPRARRRAGIGLMISAVMGTALIGIYLTAVEFSGFELLPTMAYVALVGAAAFAMLRAARKKPSANGGSEDPPLL